MPKPKSPLALRREHDRVERAFLQLHERHRRRPGSLDVQATADYYELCGARQALAWALGEHVMRPARCVVTSQRRVK